MEKDIIPSLRLSYFCCLSHHCSCCVSLSRIVRRNNEAMEKGSMGFHVSTAKHFSVITERTSLFEAQMRHTRPFLHETSSLSKSAYGKN